MTTTGAERRAEELASTLYDLAVDNHDGDCDDCKFLNRWKEPHGEQLCECIVPAPKDCPVVEQIAAALYQHVTVLVKK